MRRVALLWVTLAFVHAVVSPRIHAQATAARPTTARSTVLAEGWRFQPDPLNAGDAQHWESADFDRSQWSSVAVPGAWDFYSPAMDGYEGTGWYALDLPRAAISDTGWQRLVFGRANYSATVWINGRKAGENLCGYLPFEVPLTPFVGSGGPVSVVVRVENGTRFDWLPGATTVEWVQYGGLLEPVELVATDPVYIAHLSVHARPVAGGAHVVVTPEIVNASARSFEGRILVTARDETAERTVRVVASGDSRPSIELTMAAARPWSPDSPMLYDVEVRLRSGDGDIDSVRDRFGVRSIAVSGRRIMLNDQPLRVRGVNRYDEFPGRGPVASDAEIRADLEAVKATGVNLVRTHYPQSPAHLRIADEIGLLFMEEVPLNWWRASFRPAPPPEFDHDRIVDLAESALEQMVRRDGNHPSLIIWSVSNECETADALGIRTMQRLLRRAKELDPTRLATYVADRNLAENRAFADADLVAINTYLGMWDGPPADDISEVEDRVYAPTLERLQSTVRLFPGKPILVAEFGTIGVPAMRGDVRFSEDFQAAYVSAVWRAITDVPEVSGGVVWAWADYRHRRGFINDFPAYIGPFGIVTIDRTPKQALAALTALWSESRP